MIPPNVDRELDTFADMCAAFYEKLLAREFSDEFAQELVAAFLSANIKAGAALQALSEQQMMAWAGQKQ